MGSTLCKELVCVLQAEPGQDRALPHSVPTPDSAPDAAADEPEPGSCQAAQPSAQIDATQPSPAEAQSSVARAGDAPVSAAAVRALLPAPGSRSGTLPPCGPAPIAASGAEAAAVSSARRPAALTTTTADALRQQQRAARSLSLAEYFVKRRGTLNPEDSFRIFCQVRALYLTVHESEVLLQRPACVRGQQRRVIVPCVDCANT